MRKLYTTDGTSFRIVKKCGECFRIIDMAGVVGLKPICEELFDSEIEGKGEIYNEEIIHPDCPLPLYIEGQKEIF